MKGAAPSTLSLQTDRFVETSAFRFDWWVDPTEEEEEEEERR